MKTLSPSESNREYSFSSYFYVKFVTKDTVLIGCGSCDCSDDFGVFDGDEFPLPADIFSDYLLPILSVKYMS